MSDFLNPIEKMAADSTGKNIEHSANTVSDNTTLPEGGSSVENTAASSVGSQNGQKLEDEQIKNENGAFVENPDPTVSSVENPETAETPKSEGESEPKNDDILGNFDEDEGHNEDQQTDLVNEEILVRKEKPSYVYNFKTGQFIPGPSDLITANYEGPCKFGLIFPGGQNMQASNIQVSNLMNRVYLKMNTTVAIKFTLDPTKAPTTDLYIRATPRFSSMDSVQFPVDRCKVHLLEDDPRHCAHEFEHLCKCIYYNLAGHVVRSPTHGAIYCYDPMSGRHSVLSPIKSRSHDIVYSFHCKSSCPKGIDRRPLSIVFTLEQLNGLVLGQTSINVKICSSPKRDRNRNENFFIMSASKKNKLSHDLNEAIDSDSGKSTGNAQDAQAVTTAGVVSKVKSDLHAISYHLRRAEKLFASITQTVNTLETKSNE